MRSGAIAAGGLFLTAGALVASTEPKELTLFEAITAALWGSTGTYLQFIGTAIVFIGVAYLLTVPYAERRDTWMQLELLRYGSNHRWLIAVVRRIALPAAALPIGLSVASTAWYLLLGGRTFTLPTVGLMPWLFQLLVNGALQLLVYVLVLLTATIGTSNRVGGLAAAAVLLALGFPHRQPQPLLPVQLSGMGYALDGWRSALPVTATLFVTTTATALIALLVLQRLRRTT